jgi:hypothetical protein
LGRHHHRADVDAPSDQKVTMKKTTPKLVLRRETLRALASIELTHAAGGGDAALPRESGRKQCTFVLQGVDELTRA